MNNKIDVNESEENSVDTYEEYTVYAGMKRHENKTVDANMISSFNHIKKMINEQLSTMIGLRDHQSSSSPLNAETLNMFAIQNHYSQKIINQIKQKTSSMFVKKNKRLIYKEIQKEFNSKVLIVNVDDESSTTVRSVIEDLPDFQKNELKNNFSIVLLPVISVNSAIQFDNSVKELKELKKDYLRNLTSMDFADEEVMDLFDRKEKMLNESLETEIDSLVVEGLDNVVQEERNYNDSLTVSTLNKLMNI